jgi:benzodiazapine receptor
MSMIHLHILAVHLLATIAKLLRPMFFAAHNPLLALINIVPKFSSSSQPSWLSTASTKSQPDFVPLAAWVCFATVLNFAIWKLNP